MAKQYDDPGPRPENATPQEVEKWRRDNEAFLTEGMRKGAGVPSVGKIDATDARLKQLRREHIKFLDRLNPATDALWLALLRDAKDVLRDDQQYRDYVASLETGSRSVVHAPEMASIVAIGQQLVASALRGETTAIGQIMDRIEGKPGLRTTDVDPDDPARQRQTRDIVEKAVRALTDIRIREKQANAIDVSAEIVQPEKEQPK